MSTLTNKEDPPDQTPDRRRARRFEVNWPATLTGEGPANPFQERGSVANLSSSGALVKLDRDIEVGARVEIEINLPFKKNNLMHYSAEVIRIERQGGSAEIAIKFDTPRPVFFNR
jgi:PilZ domain-containing protein